MGSSSYQNATKGGRGAAHPGSQGSTREPAPRSPFRTRAPHPKETHSPWVLLRPSEVQLNPRSSRICLTTTPDTQPRPRPVAPSVPRRVWRDWNSLRSRRDVFRTTCRPAGRRVRTGTTPTAAPLPPRRQIRTHIHDDSTDPGPRTSHSDGVPSRPVVGDTSGARRDPAPEGSLSRNPRSESSKDVTTLFTGSWPGRTERGSKTVEVVGGQGEPSTCVAEPEVRRERDTETEFRGRRKRMFLRTGS